MPLAVSLRWCNVGVGVGVLRIVVHQLLFLQSSQQLAAAVLSQQSETNENLSYLLLTILNSSTL
jgi:hypothetical protein